MIIDKIYIINLKFRNERLINMKSLINKINIDKNKIEIYEAIDGSELKNDYINSILSISSLDSLNNISKNHKEIRTKSAIGCYLSHYKIWEKIIKEDLNNVLILEDNIKTNIFSKEFNNYIKNLPQDYDVAMIYWFTLWFDPLINPKKKEIINNNWNKYNSVNLWGCAAYMVSRKGAEKLVKDAFPICYQVDSYINILNNINSNFIRYIANESLFVQGNLDIQIKCKECDITEKINEMYNKKYNIETFSMINNNNLIFLIMILIITLYIVKNK